jgi:excisionase family DNA binding protein
MPQEPLALLEVYVAPEGDALVPKGHAEDGFALGQWVARRRLAYQQGRVDPERSPRLEELPGWSWAPQEDRWRYAYSLLVAFVRREGHAFVRQDCVESGLHLGVWVQEQRRAHKQGRLRTERSRLLASLPGWTWDAPQTRWDQHYVQLLGYVGRTGHARVPHRHLEAGTHLGDWVRAQRRSHGRGSLSEDRARRLEALPGWSWGPKTSEAASPLKKPSQPTRRSRRPPTPEAKNGAWVDSEGAGALCGLSHQTIYRLLEDGQLTASRRKGHLRIRRADVETFIDASRVVPGSLSRSR